MSCECPYCGKDNEVNHDDGANYAEGENHQMQCGFCDKYFVFETVISFYYYAEKADCLNGSGHDFQETHTIPRRYTKLECTMCGERKPLPKDHPFLHEPKITI